MIDYTWVAWFKELATKIASNDKGYLVDNAKNVDWGKDDAPLLAYGDENIDPMSFLYFLAQRNTRNQYERTFGSVHEKFEITSVLFQTNTAVMPVPTIKALFHDGKSFDPDLLWRLFKNAVQTDNNGTAIEPNDFKAALALPDVGSNKLTQTLFLANPSYFLPSDYLSTALPQPMPHGEVTDYGDYVARMDAVKRQFPGCEPYEINTFLYHAFPKKEESLATVAGDTGKNVDAATAVAMLRSGKPVNIMVLADKMVTANKKYTLTTHVRWLLRKRLQPRGYRFVVAGTRQQATVQMVGQPPASTKLIKEPSFFQVSTNPYAYADESDYWDVTDALPQEARTFKENNCVYTGGPGDQRKFPLSEPKRGDIILVRTGQQKGRAIGVVEENQYASGGWTEEAVIYVHWINKAPAPVTGKLPQLGFGNAVESTISAFRNTDAYEVSFELIDRLIGGGGVKPQPDPEPAVDTPDTPDTPDTSFPLNTILFGPPGTGKTWEAVSYAVAIMDGKAPDELALTEARENVKARFEELREEDRVEFVTFHQNYTYEDFIEGIGPVLDRDDLLYELRDGVFKRISSSARKRPNKRHVLVIDEINRGNIAKIFGELITLIEPTKRSGGEDEAVVTLPYSQELFRVPDNLYLVGTMNTADRGIALLDTALRRRFDFIEKMPDLHYVEEDIEGVDGKAMLKAMNERITVCLDREHQIGHTYLIGVRTIDRLAEAFQRRIMPLLQEYFYDDWAKIRFVLNENPFICERAVETSIRDVSPERPVFELLPENEDGEDRWKQADSYRQIYASEQAQGSD